VALPISSDFEVIEHFGRFENVDDRTVKGELLINVWDASAPA
jgi:hypothetical protein